MIQISIPNILEDCRKKKSLAEHMLDDMLGNLNAFCLKNNLDSISHLPNGDSEPFSSLFLQIKKYHSCQKPLMAIIEQYKEIIIPSLEKLSSKPPISIENIAIIKQHATKYITAREKKIKYNIEGNINAANLEDSKMNLIQSVYINKPEANVEFFLYQREILSLEMKIIADKCEVGSAALIALAEELDKSDMSISSLVFSMVPLDSFDDDFDFDEEKYRKFCHGELVPLSDYNSDDDPFAGFSDCSNDDSNFDQEFSSLSISSFVFIPQYRGASDGVSPLLDFSMQHKPVKKRERTLTM